MISMKLILNRVCLLKIHRTKREIYEVMIKRNFLETNSNIRKFIEVIIMNNSVIMWLDCCHMLSNSRFEFHASSLNLLSLNS